MGALSSPPTYPSSSSPATSLKRPPPARDAKQQPPQPRTRAGSSQNGRSPEEKSCCEPISKRPKLQDPRKSPTKEPDAKASLREEHDTQNLPNAQPRDPIDELHSDDEAQYSYLYTHPETQSPMSPHSQMKLGGDGYAFVTCSGKSDAILKRKVTAITSYQDMVSKRSKTQDGRAKRAYYGIDVHLLVSGATAEIEASKKAKELERITKPVFPSVEDQATVSKKPKRFKLWMEKYRARKFVDLVGDDFTNRQVLRWLKHWDPVVFPHSAKSRPILARKHQDTQQEENKPYKNILMLTGPPGLGKTTLAHVCARQAGYEVMEINASDDRSRDVVKGRIRNSLGTESVKTVEHAKGTPGKKTKVARPMCVVVDEVDGVTTGSGASGDGGFLKSLIDLIMMDQKDPADATSNSNSGRKKKSGDFRQMRPLILICNDVYHPSLRPLRQSGLAEIIRIGKPSVDAVAQRLRTVFEREGIPCELDAARRLCEAAWGLSNDNDARRGAGSATEGDLRCVMVVGEWVAGRLKAGHSQGPIRLTRLWVERNVLQYLKHDGEGPRGLGRGGSKDIVSRVFQEGAGFPRQVDTSLDKKTRHEQPQAQLGFTEHLKKHAMERLREMVDTCGEIERIMTDVFLEFPSRDFNDDSYLTKPNQAYDWLNFHDTCSSRLFSGQEWELAPYLSQAVLACHHLFASPHRSRVITAYERQWRVAEGDEHASAPLPFTGPRADYLAYEREKQNRALLQSLQGQLPPTLMRSFRGPEDIATEFLPYLVRLVSPGVEPVVVRGSAEKESVASVRRDTAKEMVRRAALVLDEVGISLVKGKIEDANPSMTGRSQWVYRMDPDLDVLSTFETAGTSVLAKQIPVRYAVRQVLDRELHKTIAIREAAARQARFKAGGPNEAFAMGLDMLSENNKIAGQNGVPMVPQILKKDFFGRVIVEKALLPALETESNSGHRIKSNGTVAKYKVWVTYHEGLNNAVKKPLTLEEFVKGL